MRKSAAALVVAPMLLAPAAVESSVSGTPTAHPCTNWTVQGVHLLSNGA